MPEEAAVGIDEWVLRVQKTRNTKDLLRLLEQFRKGDWTAQERQLVSHTYMKVLESITKNSADSLRKPAETQASGGNDGPVWYEKM